MERARDIQHETAPRRLVRLLGKRRQAATPSLRVEVALTIRYAFPDDEASLRRLAVLDSAFLPAAPMLVAEVDGELRAALSLSTGEAIADPFHPSTSLLELLRARAEQLTGEDRGRGRQRGRILPQLTPGIRRQL